MNVLLIPTIVMQMQLVVIQLDLSLVLAMLDILVMELIVQVIYGILITKINFLPDISDNLI